MPTRISAGVGDHSCFSTFITMIPIDLKFLIFVTEGFYHMLYISFFNILM